MDADRLQQIQDVFHGALERSRAERSAYLDTACAGDPDLRTAVERFLAADQAEFPLLDAPVANVKDLDTLTVSTQPIEGRMIGTYRVGRLLGRGGMGSVYLAHDNRLHRDVALKFLPPHLSHHEEAKSRFRTEARAAAALDHRNVATVYEIGETPEGRLYIAMGYYEGETLKQKISKGPLSLDITLDLALQMAEGLGAAHRKGVIHRDVKPANILITEDDTVKLLDFGVAKVSGLDLTRTGMTMGTVTYMSPEQARGEEIDRRTDLWSLGVVLYEMLTGTKPFRGSNEHSIIYSILHDRPPPLNEIRSEIPYGLMQVVLTLLRKEPGARYQFAEEVVQALQLFRQRGNEAASAPRPAISPTASIAVLPFSDMSPERDQEYFCDGMAEEIINALTRVPGLRVVARTSAFAFKGQSIDIRDIRRQLLVETVLMGSVRKMGNRLRITAQLINVSDGYNLWSERYDQTMDDVFQIQDEISMAIVDKLKTGLLGTEQEHLVQKATDNMDAYTLYLKGRFHRNKFTPAGLEQAIECFKQVVELDPNMARAYIDLADAYTILGGPSLVVILPPRQAYALANEAIQKALKLDDSLAEAQTALGAIRMSFEWDWPGARAALYRAMELSPSIANTHFWRSWYYLYVGRLDEAVAAARHAEALDPLSLITKVQIGACQFVSRRFDEAVETFRQVLLSDSNFFQAHLLLGDVHLTTGRLEEAEQCYLRAQDLVGQQPILVVRLGSVAAMRGQHEAISETLEKLNVLAQTRYVPPTHIASIYAAIGQYDEAFTWVDRAYEERDALILFLDSWPWPVFDTFRQDPRWKALRDKLGL